MVYAISQDKRGFIWMGTEAGLVRFDGTDFKIFTNQDGLPDNEVLDLIYDSIADRLWIYSYSRKACYYHAGVFYSERNDSLLAKIEGGTSTFIRGSYSGGGDQAIMTGNSLYRYAHGRMRKYDGLTDYYYQSHFWNDSTFEVLGTRGLEIYRSAKLYKRIPVNIRRSVDDKGVSHEVPYTPYLGFWNGKGLILVIADSIILMSKQSDGDYIRTRTRAKKTNTLVSNLFAEGDKFIYSVVGEGVYEVDTALRGPEKCILKCNVNKVFRDRDGDIWVAIKDGGACLLRKGAVLDYTSQDGPEHDNINTITFGEGNSVYLGNSVGEIFWLDSGSSMKLLLKPVWQNTEKIRGMVFRDHMLYFISDGGFYRCDRSRSKAQSEFLQTVNGKSLIYSARSGSVLGAEAAGVFCMRDTLLWYIRHKRITALAEHPDGTLLGGSIDGVYRISTDKITLIDSLDQRIKKRITSLAYSPDSLLWIGTTSDGVMVYNGKKICVQISGSSYGAYIGRMCRKIISVRRGEVWVATNSGVNRILYHYRDSLMVDNITPLNMTDGLMSDDVNDIVLRDSMLYVATSKGLSVLDLRNMVSEDAFPIYITALRIDGRDSLVHGGTYHLSYSQNNLLISYIGISYHSAGFIRYQYRLLGSSDEWQTTTNNSLELRSLSAGKYTFEVAVLDKFGTRSKQTAKMSFVITPVYYRTYWFWVFIFFTALALGYYLIRRRFENQRESFEKEQALNIKIIDLEQQALKAQMNPHFIFNCLASIQHFINKDDSDSANRYLSNFAKLIRKTLDLSGEQHVSLERELAYLENYIEMEKLRFQNKFDYNIEVDPSIELYSISVPPMLMQPIVENAIRHGLRYKEDDTGLLTLSFSYEQEKLICTIDDNGIGRKRSEELKTDMHIEYQSRGTTLTQARIQAINMISERKIEMTVIDKYDERGIAMGTRVTITFEQS